MRPYPGQNEKPGVVDDEMQIIFALFGGPTNELISWSSLPSSGTKTKKCYDLASSTYKVT